MKREMWASFDENYNYTVAEVLKEIKDVRCEVGGFFVSIFYDDEAALERAHSAILLDPRLASFGFPGI